MPELCLCIDLGTGGPKVGLVTLEGRILATELHSVETHYGPDGAAEQDAEQWWQLVLQASSRLLETPGVSRGDVVAVAVTGQWASTVPVDAEGRPTGPCIMWMDTRGGSLARARVGGAVQGYRATAIARWVTKTGGAPSTAGADPIGHLLYLHHADPAQLARTRWFLEPVDYLTMRFTGVASASHASMQGAWLTDNRRLDDLRYDAQLLKILELDDERLPPLRPIGTVIAPVQAEVAQALGLGPDVAVLTGLPDLQAAALGSGGTELFNAHVALSTTSWISCPVPKKQTDALHSIATVPGLTNDSYLLANNQETGAKALDWLRRSLQGFGADRSFTELCELAAQAPPGAGGVLFTPWLAGERSPVEDHHARGGLQALSLSTGAPELARAVLEGVAFNTRWLLAPVEKLVKHTLTPIRLVGGGAQSELWCQIYADVLNRPIDQVADPMYAQLRGMAACAGVALGRFGLEDVEQLLPPARRFEPLAANAARYERMADELPGLFTEQKKRGRRLSGLT